MHALLLLLAGSILSASSALAVEVTSFYRGSCQVDTGVILRVDNKQLTYLGLDGRIHKIPRYEVVGAATYALPDLPPFEVETQGADADFIEFLTYRNGSLQVLSVGWPIEYNHEHIQVLTRDGRDHLIERNAIWGVKRVAPPAKITIGGARPSTAHPGQRYKLRHPLVFEHCRDNITRGDAKMPVVPVIPQTTYDNPIALKRQHDHLRDGYKKIVDYEDRQRFYAIPQYYTNRTSLGTWGFLGSRYANVGARQANFLPLVQDELSEGPFGFQRVVRSGVAPLAWSLHEEPIVQIFYGLKADYIHFEFFFDPTSPLIGVQYNYSKGQLNKLDDRLIEKGGLEFGFDFGQFSVFVATAEGNMAVRADDFFLEGSFSSTLAGASWQYNYYRLGFMAGGADPKLDDRNDDVKFDFKTLKIFAGGRWGEKLKIKMQAIQRQLDDQTAADKLESHYSGKSETFAAELSYDLDYRWTVYALPSVEHQTARVTRTNTSGDTVDRIWPKLFGGVTIAF